MCAGPRKKIGKSQRFSVRFSSLEGLFVWRGVHVDIFLRPCEAGSYANPGGVFGSCLDGCTRTEVPGLVNKRGSKTMEAQIRSGAVRDLPSTFFVSEACVVVEGRRSS